MIARKDAENFDPKKVHGLAIHRSSAALLFIRVRTLCVVCGSFSVSALGLGR
jgi:hypothetical protein